MSPACCCSTSRPPLSTPQAAALAEELIKFQILLGRIVILVSHDSAAAHAARQCPAAADGRGNGAQSSKAQRHELRAALRHRSRAGGVAARRQRGDLAGLPPRLGGELRRRRGAHGGAAGCRGLRAQFHIRADLAAVDDAHRARDGAGRRLRAGAAAGAPLAQLADLRSRQRDAAAGRRPGHALCRGRGGASIALVCAALHRAHPRHGARQHADERAAWRCRRSPRAPSASGRRSRRASRSAPRASRPSPPCCAAPCARPSRRCSTS